MLILVFAVALGGLLPAYGSGSLRHLILPALTLAAAPLAQNVRLIRSGMLEVLQQDYVRTARAKGLAERGVVYRHALRNAACPFLTVTGLSLGFMLSGTIVIETVFSWPGLGRLIVQAVPGRDFPVIQAAVVRLRGDLRGREPDRGRRPRPGRSARSGRLSESRWSAVGRHGVALVGVLVIVASAVLAALAPALAPADPIRNDLLSRV